MSLRGFFLQCGLVVAVKFLIIFYQKKSFFYGECDEYLSYNECYPRLSDLKKEITYLKEVDFTALVQSLRNLETAVDRFFF